MKNTNELKYTSIDSVLYDLHTVFEDQNWSETRMREWATRGYLKANLPAKYDIKTDFLIVEEHKSQVPTDAKYILQIAYKDTLSEEDLEALKNVLNVSDEAWNPSLRLLDQDQPLPASVLAALTPISGAYGWKPLRLTQNSFFETLTLGAPDPIVSDYTIDYNCPHCNHEYSVDANGCITTTLKEGYLYVSYYALLTDTKGYVLIPDNENLKEAIFHYCMYRYWMTRSTMKDQGSIQERNFHLKQYEVLKAKAVAEINSPDLAQMENLKNQGNKLFHSEHEYDKFFSKIVHPQSNF